MKRCFSVFILSFISIIALAQNNQGTDSIRQRIFLIGDAGELAGDKQPVVDWLKKNVNWDDEKNTAIFLGDNIYEEGLPPAGSDGYPHAKKIIDAQIDLVKGKKAKAYFIPGNHDWKGGKIGGWEQIVNQVDYINSLEHPSEEQRNIFAEPRNGCPGPVEIILDSQVVVILMDSQWFLHVHDKPGESSGCTSKTIDEFTTELEQIIRQHPDQLVVLALHHPLHTHGVHGGAYTLKHHIFPLAEAVRGLYIPLPIIGSIYPIARGLFGNIQDVNHPLYRGMANAIEDVIETHPNVIIASGHDHSLQLLQHDSVYQIVSGSAIKQTRISRSRHNNDLLFSDVNWGFAVIEIRKSGKVETKFYNVNSKDYNDPIFAKELKTIKKTTPPAMDSIRPLPPYITAAANPKLEGSGLKYLFQGRNYRNEWTEPITVPVLDLGKEAGGLTPTKQGGGKQTKSLRLEDKSGKEWALRSVQKYPEAAIPADLRQTFAENIVADGISAAYPYASLSIAPLAKAAGIPVIRRKVVYVPDDPRLDRFREEFDSTLAILEEREPIGVGKTDNTDEIVLKLAKDNDNHIDQKAVLKARLLDNFIMDFDRHEDQWRWATKDTGKGKLYYAIPRDHDQAFFVNQGLIPYLARKPWIIPEIQGFEAHTDNIKTFNRPARNFDRFFLTHLDEDAWQKQIDTFLSAMTDDVIEQALQQQPKEIQQYSMNNIIAKLKERKKYFREDMMQYYRFISKEVSIVGSNQREQFLITKNEDGTTHVLVNKIDKEGKIAGKMYERTFVPSVTKELRFYGLGDNDRFVVNGDRSSIKMRIVGGPGNDEFVNNGSGDEVILYDVSFEENKITGNAGFKNKISDDPQVNRYERLNYSYDIVRPGLSFAYNVDDGLYLGAQVEVIKQGFRKEPYASRHLLRANRAIQTASYRFVYEGDFMKAVGNQDLLIRADARAPINVTNFFGLGNDTYFDKNKPGAEKYYRTRYDIVNANILLRRQLQSWMRINYGAVFQYFKLDQEGNAGKFITENGISGIDQETLYDGRSYAGAMFKLDINSRNNQVLPTRGFLMDFNVRPMLGLNKNSNNLAQVDIDMRVYASIFRLPRIVVASRLGYGRNFGDFEFQQAYYLGGTENLRGYRRHRFAGRTMLFNNSEIRFKIADFNTYLFPGQIGLLVFNDVGRVWQDGEKSTDWHVGNGGGIWLAPVKRFVISALATRSKEEKLLPYVTFGFQF